MVIINPRIHGHVFKKKLQFCFNQQTFHHHQILLIDECKIPLKGRDNFLIYKLPLVG